MSKHPLFAVVGHPNKGKSSVVAALTQNDQVRISPISGTTQVAQHFTLSIDHQIIFELVDTPGFQRANGCLTWLKEEEVTAAQRPERIAAFVQTFRGSNRFFDEVELLSPIVEGAGIIYVVDGSLPYSPEYETEMEILRWTGRPRLALINPIGGSDYVVQWQQALTQYFSLVRIFDPLHASFDQHLQLLHAFAQMDMDNTGRFDHAIAELEKQRERKLQQAARFIVENLQQLLCFQMEEKRLEQAARAKLPSLLPEAIEAFNQQLNRMERNGQRQLETLFLHHHLEPEIAALTVYDSELMDQSQWSLWGLERHQLALVSAGAGALLGLAVDAGIGGASLLTGALSGSLVGGVTGWLGGDWLKSHLPSWLPFSSDTHTLGPVTDPNFPFVILGRTLTHARAMLARSHADHGRLTLIEEIPLMQRLDTRTQVRLLRQCRQLAKQGMSSKAAEQLIEWVTHQIALH